MKNIIAVLIIATALGCSASVNTKDRQNSSIARRSKVANTSTNEQAIRKLFKRAKGSINNENFGEFKSLFPQPQNGTKNDSDALFNVFYTWVTINNLSRDVRTKFGDSEWLKFTDFVYKKTNIVLRYPKDNNWDLTYKLETINFKEYDVYVLAPSHSTSYSDPYKSPFAARKNPLDGKFYLISCYDKDANLSRFRKPTLNSLIFVAKLNFFWHSKWKHSRVDYKELEKYLATVKIFD